MSIKFRNFIGENDNIEVVEEKGIFMVIKHALDLSCYPGDAQTKYFMAEMNCCRRQVVIELKDNAVRLQPGAMQFMTGSVQMATDVKGLGDLAGKLLKSKVTNNSPIKALYRGTGVVTTESTYSHILLEDVDDWGGAIVCDDGMFIACDDELKDTVQARRTVSSAVMGGEGFFNLCLKGSGVAALRSHWPREELVEVYLDNDQISIDGNNAVCWSSSLQFTTEMSSRSLFATATTGEGLVNVYRGTGRISMGPDKS